MRSPSRRLRSVCLALLVPLTVSGFVAFGVAPPAVANASPGSPGAVPVQLGGDASRPTGAAAQGENREVPPSTRSKYPTTPPTAPEIPDNRARTASVAKAAVTGFDAKTSREIVARRTATTRTYANTDGSETTQFADTTLNVQDEHGRWAAAAPAVARRGAAIASSGTAVPVQIASRADADRVADVDLGDGRAVSWRLDGARAVAATTGAAAVTFAGVLPGVSLELAPQVNGVKETLVLASASAPSRYTFPLRLTGVQARRSGNEVELVDSRGSVVARIPAGSMVDSATGPTGPARSGAVHYSLAGSGAATALVVDVDRAWLADPARVYPVRVDPSVDTTKVGVTAVDASGSRATSTSFELGPSNGQHAAVLSFPEIVSALAFQTIYGVQLTASTYDAPSCSPRPVTVSPVTAAVTAATTVNTLATGPVLDSESMAYGYSELGVPYTNCTPQLTAWNLGTAGRDMVKRWVDGSAPNYGIALRTPNDPMAHKRVVGLYKDGTSDTSGNPPTLYVTHSPYNATYSIPSPNPDPPVLQEQDGKVKVTVTNTSASAWSPGSYYLAYRAFLDDDAKGQQRSADLTTTVPRGGTVTFDATIKALPAAEHPYVIDFTMVKTGGPVFTDEQVPPGRLLISVLNLPPAVQQLYPPNGYQAPTLTPQLFASAIDVDTSAAVDYRFTVCAATGDCTTPLLQTSWMSSKAWTIPAPTLRWNQAYSWFAEARDRQGAVTKSDRIAIGTDVPQPAITATLAGAPGNDQQHEFDPVAGNYSTAAVDAPVTTSGPSLSVSRVYNSLDPRTTGAFGAGWSTLYDMRVAPEADGTGNVLVTLPDGQTVRFAKNPDGSFAGPRARQELLTLSGTQFTLRDGGGSSYLFNDNGSLASVKAATGRPLTLKYSPTDGKLSTATSGNSNRILTFTWTGAHVTSVSTPAVDGTTPTWRYSYTGDSLTRACAADGSCTAYGIGSGSHYRSAVTDSAPDSYWRLGDAVTTGAAASEVAVNLGKDAGTYVDVTGGTSGALASSTDTAVTLNGTSSRVTLPAGTAKKSRDMAVELWFKTTAAGSPQPLLGYQNAAITATPTTAAPILYVGADGKLRGQFWGGAVSPITTGNSVNDGVWHQVVLSANAGMQSLYLDGVLVKTVPAAIDHAALTYDQVGAAYVTSTSAWPGWQNTIDPSKTTNRAFFKGSVDEVSIYSHPLGPDQVAAHRALATTAATEMTTVTLPGGAVATSVAYDNVTDRVETYSDRNGGTWKIGRPLVAGGDTDLRRSVLVLDPADRPWLYEYDALSGRLLRTGSPLGKDTRPEDGRIGPDPTPPPTPVEKCSRPDPRDPGFCTYDVGSTEDPTFHSYDASGMGVRSYYYDDQGRLTTVVDENSDVQSMTYDDHQNVITRKPCRAEAVCPTSYSTYPTGLSDPLDPRWNKPLELRDARSSGPTDNTYRTTYTYTTGGAVLTQQAADGGVVTTAYTAGNETGADGAPVPSGLPASSRDARGAVTKFTYNSTGDLAVITEPSGLVTSFTYDALGRKVSQTEKSDSYPAGLVTTYTYDSLSRLLSTTDPATTNVVTGVAHQQRTAQAFDADGRVTTSTVSDVAGNDPTRTTTYEYDEHGRLAAVVDPAGARTSYSYDVFGNTMSTTTADGSRWEYAYSARNSLTTTSVRDLDADHSGATVLAHTTYDMAGRVYTQTDAMGRLVLWTYWPDGTVKAKTMKFRDPADQSVLRDYVLESDTYDGAGNLLTQTTGNGTTTTVYTRDAVGRTASMALDPDGVNQKVRYTYDLAGNPTRVDTTGNASNLPVASTAVTRTTTSVYDTSGRVTSQSVAATSSSTLTTQFGYDQRGLTTSVVDPRGAVNATEAQKYRTEYSYDELGRLVGTTSPPVSVEQYNVAATTARPATATGYDTFGATVSLRDPLGRVTATTYDRLGRVATSTSPSYTPPGQTDPIAATVTNSYDVVGRLTASTDPTGTTKYAYDRLGHQTSVDAPVSDSDRAVTRYSYSSTGLLLSTTDALGAVRSATYDDLDRQVTSTISERRPNAVNLTTKMRYDDANNLVASTSPTGAVVSSTYDRAGQLLTTTNPNGVKTSWSYNGFGDRVRVTDALGRATSTQYDLAGRQTRTADIAPTGGELRTQLFAYDAAGNVTSATPSNGNPTTYTYDANDNMVSQTEPVTSSSTITTSFGYDATGQRTRYTDGRNNASWMTYNSWGLPESMIAPPTPGQSAAPLRTWKSVYDAAGRQTRVVEPGGVTQTFTYDAAGNMLTAAANGAEAGTTSRRFTYDVLGQVTGQSSPGGMNTYTYDDRGDPLTAAGPGGSATFKYDNDGQLTQRTDAAGTATFGYDKGRLATQNDPVTGTAQTFSYDPTGATSAISYNSGRVRSFTYDDLGRIATDTLRSTSAAANAPAIASIAYGYDLDNHVTSKTTTGTAGAAANKYTYDLAGRLTSWKAGSTTTTYGWDASSNRTSVNGKTASFDARNRLISDGTSDYSYTARGTIQSKTTGSQTENFSFDGFDRMVADGAATYAYDSFDRVTSTNGTAMQYSGGDDDPVSDGAQVFGRGLDGDVVSIAQGATKRSVLTDAHGDVVAGFDPTTTAATTLTDSKAFDPWGAVTAKSGTSFSLGFQGDWTDPTTGEVDMGARWYDTASGTFDSQDTVQYGSGPSALANKYLYGAGDPVTNDDPTGNWPHCGICERAAHAVSSAVSSAGRTISHAVSTGWSVATHYASVAWDYTKRAASAIYNGFKSALSAVAAGASWLYNKVKSAAGIVIGAVVSGYQWVAGKVSQGVNWAKQKAQQAVAAAHAAAVRVTQATKAAIAYAVQHNPLPAIAAVVKPLYEGVKTVVSAVASLPAAVVAVTVDVIEDTVTAAQAVYHAAVAAAGAVVTAVSTAVTAAGNFVADHWKTIVAVAAGIAVGLACTAVTAGAGAAACFIAGGALVGALSNSLNCPPGKSIAGCAAKGAVAGAIGAAVTVATGGAGGVLVTALGSAAGAAAEDASLQYLNTGRVDATEVVTSAAVGGAAGAAGAKLRGCNCFAAGTDVKTDDGEKPIEKIAVGDKVWAKDLSTGKNELRTVKSLFRKTATAMMALVVAGSTVAVTTEHPFYTADRGWVESGDLEVGEHLVTVNGSDATVDSITYENTPTTVYNFEVEGDHNYYIGASSLLVHNCNETASSGSAKPAVVNKAGREYPQIPDPRTGNPIASPPSGLSKVAASDRVPYDSRLDRHAFIKEWHERGFPRPEGGWSGDVTQVHHIIPRQYGGTNDFDNLVPLSHDDHAQFTSWWRDYDGQ